MSYFIVEHRIEGKYTIETICGVEDIDMSRFTDLMGLWECGSVEETRIMEKELKEMRHARSSQPA